MNIGQDVAEARRRLHLTQEDLAARTGVSVRSIRNLESGSITAPRPATVRILREALGLDRPAPRRVRPMHLPPDVPGFTGRGSALGMLDRLVDDAVDGAPAAVIAGAAGIGKTSLAVHWAHRQAGRFPDGVLYTNLRGFDPGEAAADPADAVRGFLEALGVPVERIPLGLEARTGLFRSVLAGRRVLVVLDNARNAEQVRPLLPAAPGCMTVVTSRDNLAALVAVEGARPVRLDEFTRDEAHDLLRIRIGEQRLAAEQPAAGEIVRLCAGLPLALAVVAAHAVVHPALPLAGLAAELRAGRWALDPGDIRTVFSWSVAALSPPAGQLFRLLALHPGPDASVAAVASLAGVPVPDVRPRLAELVAAHLVTEQRPGRYGFHDLVRVYATGLASRVGDDIRRGARERMLDHYLHSAYGAGVRMQPHWGVVEPAPASPGVTVEPDGASAGGAEAAQAWFAAERAVLLRVVSEAAATGFDVHAGQLAWALTAYLAPQGLWADQRDTQRVALDAARRRGDRAGQAQAHRLLARAWTHLGRLDRAETHLVECLALFAAVGDHAGQAQAHHNLAELRERAGHPAEALGHAQQAVELYRAAGNRSGEARARNGVGWCHAKLGRYALALTYCREALALQEASGDLSGQASTLDSLGFAYLRLDRPGEAIACFRRSITLFRQIADRVNEAATLAQLGDACERAGDAAGAGEARRQAIEIFDDLDRVRADELRGKLGRGTTT